MDFVFLFPRWCFRDMTGRKYVRRSIDFARTLGTYSVVNINVMCRMRSIAAHRDHFVQSLYVLPSGNILTHVYAPRRKMARGHEVFALSVIPSFCNSFASKFVVHSGVFSIPPTSLHGFEWNLVQILYHKSRRACGKIIHVRQILAELWPLTLRIFTHFSLSSQLPLHPFIDLNETWQGCCTRSLEVHVGR